MTPPHLASSDWSGHTFYRICVISPERDQAGQIIEYRPQSAYKHAASARLHVYGAGAFCRFRIPQVPHLSGVYVITCNGVVTYVGECTDLASSRPSNRFNAGYGRISPRNCYVGGQETNCRINQSVWRAAQQGETIHLWFLLEQNRTRRRAIEAALIRALHPAWNRQTGGRNGHGR